MTTLVTGGSGFVGSNIVRQLALEGHTVLSMDLNPPDALVQKYLAPWETHPWALWVRQSQALASIERTKAQRKKWEKKFFSILEDFKFVPGGRIMHGAGREDITTTLNNCYVVGIKDDSINSIYKTIIKIKFFKKRNVISSIRNNSGSRNRFSSHTAGTPSSSTCFWCKKIRKCRSHSCSVKSGKNPEPFPTTPPSTLSETPSSSERPSPGIPSEDF